MTSVQLLMQTMKFAVVGDGNVGKTSLLVSYATNCSCPTDSWDPCSNSVHFNVSVRFDKRKVVDLGLFDTQGLEDFDWMRRLVYQKMDVLIVCFSLVNTVSFEDVKSKWLSDIRHHCPDKPIILVGTKLDLRKDEEVVEEGEMMGHVTHEQGHFMSKDIGACKYVECSARTQEGLKEVFDEAVRAALAKLSKEKKKPTKRKMCSFLSELRELCKS